MSEHDDKYDSTPSIEDNDPPNAISETPSVQASDEPATLNQESDGSREESQSTQSNTHRSAIGEGERKDGIKADPSKPKKQQESAKVAEQESVVGDDQRENQDSQRRDIGQIDDPKPKNIIGQINNYNYFSSEKGSETRQFSFDPLGPSDRKKIEQVYVPSLQYSEFVNGPFQDTSGDDERVFVLCGESHAGKFASAVHLGLALHNKERNSEKTFHIYRYVPGNIPSLLDFIDSDKLIKETVYIMELAFERGVNIAHLSSAHISSVNSALSLSKSFLLLTTEHPQEQFVGLQARSIYIDSRNEVNQIFSNHLAFFSSSHAEVTISTDIHTVLETISVDIIPKFLYPFQIDRFFVMLGRSSVVAITRNSEISIEDLLFELAVTAGKFDLYPENNWFISLTPNAQIYAILSVLFEGVNRYEVDEIYSTSIEFLRNNGLDTLQDPRETGLDDILEKIHAEETVVGTLQFVGAAYKNEIIRQIRNHHHLVWSLIEVFRELIEDYSAPSFWEFRLALGAAIGRIGVFHPHKLENVLVDLARHKKGSVAAVAGYALDELCRNHLSTHSSFVLELLNNWAESGDPDLQWAACASIERIYDSVNEIETNSGADDARIADSTLRTIHDLLTKLARNFASFNQMIRIRALHEILEEGKLKNIPVDGDVRSEILVTLEIAHAIEIRLAAWATANLNAIFHAIRRMSARNAVNVVRLLNEWIKETDDSSLQLMAAHAGNQLIQASSNPNILPTEDRYFPLIDLISPLLAVSVPGLPNTAELVSDALLSWLSYPEWSHKVFSALLRLVNCLPSKNRNLLCVAILDRWLDCDNEDAIIIAYAIARRAHLMNGFPPDLSERKTGLIIVDDSRKARVNRVAESIGRVFYLQLRSQIIAKFLYMGHNQSSPEFDKDEVVFPERIGSPKPRLLAPILEKFNVTNVSFVLIFTWGNIIDLEDLLATPWQDRLVIVSPDEDIVWPEPINILHLAMGKSINRFSKIENMIQEKINEAGQAAHSLDAPEETSASYLAFETSDFDMTVRHFDEMIENLDDPEHAGKNYDIAHRIISAIVFLYETCQRDCIRLLQSWLCSEEIRYQSIGNASTKAILRNLVFSEKIPDLDVHNKFFVLIPRLIADDLGTMDILLHAAWKWIVDREWYDLFMTTYNGGAGIAVQIVELVRQESLADVRKSISDWRENMNLAEDLIQNQSIDALIEQFNLHISIRLHQHLPELPNGEKYSLILLDSSSRYPRIRQTIAQICSQLLALFHDLDEEVSNLNLLVYRMGENMPIAGPREQRSPEAIIPNEIGARPRLIMPILDRFDFQNLSAVILITTQPTVDQDDWQGTQWNDVISVYSPTNRAMWSDSTNIIPVQESHTEAASKIAKQLRFAARR